MTGPTLGTVSTARSRCLEHAIRAACDVTGDTEVWIFGSQAILGTYPDAPESLRRSAECDVVPKSRPDMVGAVDAVLGQLSQLTTLCPTTLLRWANPTSLAMIARATARPHIGAFSNAERERVGKCNPLGKGSSAVSSRSEPVALGPIVLALPPARADLPRPRPDNTNNSLYACSDPGAVVLRTTPV